MSTHTVYLLSLAFLVNFCTGSLAVAQRQGDATSAPAPGRMYRLETKYTAGVAQKYELLENCAVVRTQSDGSKKEYTREVKQFITIRTIESMNGISKIVVNLDSLMYKFNSETGAVDYDSQIDVTPKPFADLNTYLGPLNRSFTMTVNSYGEITKIEGEDIDFWRDYISENSVDLDSVTALLWKQALSDDNLKHMGDLQKRIVPGLKVGVDSTWQHELGLRVNGILYKSPVTSKFSQNTGGFYILTTKDTLRANPQSIRTQGMPDISHLNQGYAAVDGELTLRNTGVIEELLLKVKAWYQATVLMETYTEDITATYTWKLTGQYQW